MISATVASERLLQSSLPPSVVVRLGLLSLSGKTAEPAFPDRIGGASGKMAENGRKWQRFGEWCIVRSEFKYLIMNGLAEETLKAQTVSLPHRAA
jgi:hypothetical protein